ncbi:uncharacterized protein EV422DRAFT_535429 [Fimicolochytrium jonesii]|uniref:uncharacterized protein n=1 Tax=Fimicolochytrium jonesii TaxID=1396493 RepID=UPI0022FE8814|nr:uncharacterized protein EV422DRAFT_535429 [Fimicolochytrium jonesii]KAI8819192.1 hypothetical protein EV422DRAFT_535429 [Fimicolochytrium jonesii]
MPRKDYQKDVAALQGLRYQLGGGGCVRDVVPGQEDGEVNFSFQYDDKHWLQICIQFQDLFRYPTGSSGFIFFAEGNVDGKARGATESVLNVKIDGKPVHQVVQELSWRLCQFFCLSQEFLAVLSSPTASHGSESDDHMSNHSDMSMDTDGDSGTYDVPFTSGNIDPHLRSLLLRDVFQLRACGYTQVGYLTYDTDSGFMLYISTSVRCLLDAELLNEDQCAAWYLDVDKYVVILMKFDSAYGEVINHGHSKEHGYVKGMQGDPNMAFHRQPQAQFRCMLSSKPIVSAAEAFLCFQRSTANRTGSLEKEFSDGATQTTEMLSPFLLSWTLCDLLETKFLPLLTYRLERGCSWTDAEAVIEGVDAGAAAKDAAASILDTIVDSLTKTASSRQNTTKKRPGKVWSELDAVSCPYQVAYQEAWAHHLNLPLLVVRYVLRRLSLAAKYCLVCHKRTLSDFEPLKPYVCSADLCTHQFLQLGLGPSIELEVMHHPDVVDLLVSLAYTAALSSSLTPFPHGVGVEQVSQHDGGTARIVSKVGGSMTVQCYGRCTTLRESDVIQFRHRKNDHSFKLLGVPSHSLMSGDLTCRCTFTVQRVPPSLEDNTALSNVSLPYTFVRSTWSGWHTNAAVGSADMSLFTQTLDLLPKIRMLRKALKRQLSQANSHDSDAEESDVDDGGAEDSDEESKLQRAQALEEAKTLKMAQEKQNLTLLRRLTTLTLRPILDPINPLIYPLLRWIICSNRSFIKELKGSTEKIAGVGVENVQFKMVMSTPEKEARFIRERNLHASSKNVKSLWAFHGSPLHNWHSILRTGLNTDRVAHGRAYGNGIYHALQSVTAAGYAARTGGSWPHSSLGVVQCMSLNEIVNCPSQFVSTNPYLVVGNIDWVQTRFLMARHTYRNYNQTGSSGATPEIPTVAYHAMDTSLFPVDITNTCIKIPILTYAHRESGTVGDIRIDDPGILALENEESESQARCRKRKENALSSPGNVSNEEKSMGGRIFDTLFSSGKRYKDERSASDVVAFDDDTLFPPPHYATSSATKALFHELKSLRNLQNSISRGERGWYLKDSDISNLYQWRLRMTDFDADLPLAKDLRSKGLQDSGIELEVRFSGDFPFAPPYVRVIQPRFLQFAHGGGGHVTAGGSVCMDLLTSSGWQPTYNLESVFLQIRMALTSLDPVPARLAPNWDQPYSAREAIDAFERVAGAYGWVVPKNWRSNFSS